MERFKPKTRYHVAWRTEHDPVTGHLILRGWDVIDNKEFGRSAVATFKPNENAQAEAICKLLNSNEEIEDGVSK